EDKYRLGHLLMQKASFLIKEGFSDNNVHTMLLEAKELFIQSGAKLDLTRADKLLKNLSTSGEAIDSREALTQRRHLESLLSVTRAIGSEFNLNELLDKILDYSLKVTGAERGFLFLYNENETALSLRLFKGLDKEMRQQAFSYENYRISLELIHKIQGTQEAVMVNFEQEPDTLVSSELKSHKIKEIIVVPLRTREKPLGIIYLDNRLASGTFGDEELELMKSFAVQASVSIENAYLIKNLVEQERLKQELELGKTIQMNLLPKKVPEMKNLELCGIMVPAKEIGGDYYDFISLPEKDKLGIVIGDVSGKGVGAGLLMAMVKTAIHIFVKLERSPKQILLKINEILNQHIEGEKFMSMLYLIWDSEESIIHYSSAGHEHILVYKDKTEEIEAIPSGGVILGVFPDIEKILEEKRIKLNRGDKILLYTDGVTEAHNENKDRFGLEQLKVIFKKHSKKPVHEIMDSIKSEVYAFMGNYPQYDDITLVVMEAR
ncbi:MAG: SpoIIE family protein phosphatase, partial [bacterium]|nr:SpoIIE family protein phosphatase [bacterium]